jgi:hypothetical protein
MHIILILPRNLKKITLAYLIQYLEIVELHSRCAIGHVARDTAVTFIGQTGTANYLGLLCKKGNMGEVWSIRN